MIEHESFPLFNEFLSMLVLEIDRRTKAQCLNESLRKLVKDVQLCLFKWNNLLNVCLMVV